MALRSFLRSGAAILVLLFLFPSLSGGGDGNGKAVNFFLIHTGSVKGHIVPCPS